MQPIEANMVNSGPGTGKTLTAERYLRVKMIHINLVLMASSVAEIAKKPLYRVTCGDIGTSAQDVENV